MLTKKLHRISHLKWAFLAAQIGLILYCFIVMPDDLMTYLGMLIYISGIQLGLESLSDLTKMSEKEINRFRDPNFVKKQSRFLLIGIVLLIVLSLFFMSLKFVFPPRQLFNDFFNLGLDCWALILGFLCLLKYLHDKESYVSSLDSK